MPDFQTNFDPHKVSAPAVRWYIFANSAKDRFFSFKREPGKESRSGYWSSDKDKALTFTHPVPAVLFEDCLFFWDFLETNGETATMVYFDTLEPVFPP